MAKIPQRFADEWDRGFYHLFYPLVDCPGVVYHAENKGRFVLLYKAEVLYSWTEEAIPPDSEGTKYKGSWEKWFDKRKDAVEAVLEKQREIEEDDGSGETGKLESAKVWKIDVKITPMKEKFMAILNKEGVSGKSYLAWELGRTDGGEDVTIGGGSEEVPG